MMVCSHRYEGFYLCFSGPKISTERHVNNHYDPFDVLDRFGVQGVDILRHCEWMVQKDPLFPLLSSYRGLSHGLGFIHQFSYPRP